MSIITNIIFKLDIKIMYIFVRPQMRLDEYNIKNAITNIIYFYKKKNLIEFFKTNLTLIFYFFVNLLKIFYIPLIFVLYFSKYRFAQINYFQIGAVNEHLNYMAKKNYVDGFKTIFLIPKNSEFYFVSEIFKNLHIINNVFLNIILLPLKHSKLVSCKMDEVDLFMDKNLRIKKNIKATVQNKYDEKYPNLNLFKVNESFISSMDKHFQNHFPFLDLKKCFVLHQRDNYYNLTSATRGSEISTYKSMIEYILDKDYGLIRFISSDSEKLNYKNQKYLEINTDYEDEFEFRFNIKLQYYIILFAKGLICNSSGPASMGALFKKSVYGTNNYGPNVDCVTDKSTYLLKKIIHNGRELSLKELIKMKFFEGLYLCVKECEKIGLEVKNNSEKEIFDGFKDFIKIQSDQTISDEQKNFRKNLPNIELKNYKSSIAQSFILNNKNFFKGMIEN